MKVTFEDFPVGELYFAPAFFGIPGQQALIIFPIVIKHVKVCVVEPGVLGDEDRAVIVDFPVPMELVICPVTLVGQLAPLVVEFAPSMHLIVLPLPVIVASILIVELPSTIPYSIFLVPFIPTATLILLHQKLVFMR